MKTDLYTKIVLTVIAVALTANLLKDVDFVTKAHAGELDLSNMKIEQAANTNDGEITFFIYENDKISEPFRDEGLSSRSERCAIKYTDVPTYIITNKKVDRYSYMNIRKIKD